MPISLQCPCGKTLKVGEQHRGKKAKCPECGNLLLVPEAETAVQAETPPKPKPAASASKDAEKSAEPAKRNMLPLIAGGGCVLVVLFVCLVSSSVGGWAYYSSVQAEKKRAEESKKEADLRALRSESVTNLKQIGIAMHSFHDTTKHLPPFSHVHRQTGEPLLSWRVLLLPYLDQQPLYNNIRLNERWDSPHNRQFANQMPKIYELPGKAVAGKTHYQVFYGDPNRDFGQRLVFSKGFPGPVNQPRMSLVMITDGSSNTIMTIEAAQPVDWMKPDDIFCPPGPGWDPTKALGNHWGDNTFHAAMFDGAVRRFKCSVAQQELRNMILPADGNVINFDRWEAERLP